VQADPTLGEQYQTNFPTKVLVDSPETFTEAIRAQHVVSKLKGGRRNDASFVETGFLLVDVDDGLPITAFEEEYKDFTYFLATSRHHQQEKVSKSGKLSPACDRYHAYFPTSVPVKDFFQAKAYLRALNQSNPYFDKSVKDLSRAVHGNDKAEVRYHVGHRDILAHLDTLIDQEQDRRNNAEREVAGKYLETGFTRDYLLSCLKKAGNAGAFEDYADWLRLGTALKNTGYSLPDWVNLSHAGAAHACERAWNSFTANGTPTTKGTLLYFAKDYLGRPDAEEAEAKPQPGKRRIYNYESQEDGDRAQKVALVSPSPEMEELYRFYGNFVDASGNRLFLFDTTSMEMITSADKLRVSLAYHDVEFIQGNNLESAIKLPQLLEFTRQGTPNRFNCLTRIPEYQQKASTFLLGNNPVPANNGTFRRLLDTITFKSDVDRYRFCAGILSGFLNSDFNGKKPLFAMVSSGTSSGKSMVVNEVIRVVQKQTPLQFNAENDEGQLNSLYSMANKFATYDDIQRLNAKQTKTIVSNVTNTDIASWVMHSSHGNIVNNKTFWLTMTATEKISTDLKARILPIWMMDKTETTDEQRQHFEATVEELSHRSDDVIADILWHMEASTGFKPDTVLTHKKAVTWSKVIAPMVMAFFPEITEFDFDLGVAEDGLVETESHMIRVLDTILEDFNSAIYSAKNLDAGEFQVDDFILYDATKKAFADDTNRPQWTGNRLWVMKEFEKLIGELRSYRLTRPRKRTKIDYIRAGEMTKVNAYTWVLKKADQARNQEVES
jgi:hypothetical protein